MRLLLLLVLVAGTGCSWEGQGHRWDHIVVVVFENKDSVNVRDLPFFSQLRARGLEFTSSKGVARPSQPNYLALFSGSTQGVTDNGAHAFASPNLYTRCADAGLSLVSYAEGLPSPGFRGDQYPYRRKHNPAASFVNVPDDALLPFTGLPETLPSLSFVIPDMLHSMHDAPPAQADAWLREHFEAFSLTAASRRSLLVVTFDEPDTGSLDDPIYTVFVGAGIPAGGISDQPINHYTVLKALLDAFSLPPLGLDAAEAPLRL